MEFTGYCTYRETEVKALIQFTLNNEDDTFEATYLSFNDVPQNMLMLSALLEAAFTDDQLDQAVQTTENETTQNETTQNAANGKDHAEEFAGSWTDADSQRCFMTIEALGNDSYSIEINWSGSATENTVWYMTARYEEEQKGLVYTDGRRVNEVYEDGASSPDETFVYTDGTGLFYKGDEGYLCWQDDMENQGASCQFYR